LGVSSIVSIPDNADHGIGKTVWSESGENRSIAVAGDIEIEDSHQIPGQGLQDFPFRRAIQQETASRLNSFHRFSCLPGFELPQQ
jgi:hypothetical protein